ncbi:MAG: MATE family efflux transporter [Holdemania massiliensis]
MTQAVKKAKVGMNLTEGSILRCLLIFAIPIVLTNLVQQLYSMVDLAVIGQYVGTLGTIGVNTGGEIADLVAPVAMGFSTAGQIYISQLFGAGDEGKIKKTVGTLLSFMILISVVLAVVAIFFHTSILNLINCPQEAMDQASAYMVITAIGFPFIFGYYAVCGILRGMGESKRPLIFILVAAVINIFLDVVLVAGFHMEAAGTAIATVLAQLGSFGAALIFMIRNRGKFDFEPKLSYFKLDGEVMRVIIKLGIPQVVRSLLVRFSMLWVNSTANSYGVVVSSTNSIGNKLQKFLEVFVQESIPLPPPWWDRIWAPGKWNGLENNNLYVRLYVGLRSGESLLCCSARNQSSVSFTNDPQVLDLGVPSTYLHSSLHRFCGYRSFSGDGYRMRFC